jgi:DNA invertase Pin-like site-specific DNA recombinase
MTAMKITHIRRTRDQRKKRVAAYCRVSTRLNSQEESFDTQIKVYTNYIKANREWTFAGIYEDEKSATRAENRPGFQALIQDAVDGKVDLILVKSISRFSRNIVDCQNYVNYLQGNGVEIYFEKEGIRTGTPSSSMIFSFMSAVAQDESRSISENMRWSYRERYQRGEYNIGNHRILGYDTVKSVKRNPTLVPNRREQRQSMMPILNAEVQSDHTALVPNEDAWIIRQIYGMFLEGKNERQIAARLTTAGIVGRSKKPLTAGGIRYILSNEAYVGDRLLQKRAPIDMLTKRPSRTADYEHYYLENDHEAIIDRATWNGVKEKLSRHRNDLERGIRYHGGRTHALYGKIFCGVCGEPMTRRTLHGYSKKGTPPVTYKAWTCRGRHLGRKGNGCKNRTIRETEVLEQIQAQLGQMTLPTEELWILVYEERVEISDVATCESGSTMVF